MPSSISNSNDRLPSGPYLIQWFFTIGFVIVAFASIEVYLRYSGYSPTVKNDKGLWAYWRGKCEKDKTENMIVALGSSRIKSNIIVPDFIKMAGCSDYILLAIAGCDFIPILEDLAHNTEYNGTVICSIVPQVQIKDKARKQFDNRPYEFLEYYHNEYSNYSFLSSLKILPEAYCQSVLVFPSVSSSFDILVETLKKPSPRYGRVLLSRNTVLDNLNSVSAEEMAEIAKKHYTNDFTLNKMALERKFSFNELMKRRQIWMAGIRKAWNLAEIIESRGGRVIFVRMPSTGKYWEIDQALFPKNMFWDYAAGISSFPMIHFLEIPNADKLYCPDTSHLSYDDAQIFTELFTDILRQKGLLTTDK